LLRHPSPAYASRPLAPFLLAGALFLFLADVLVRYFPSYLFDSRRREGGSSGGAPGERLPDEEALRARILARSTPLAPPGPSRTRAREEGRDVTQEARKYLARRRKEAQKEPGEDNAV